MFKEFEKGIYMTKKKRRLLATKKAEKKIYKETWSLDTAITDYLLTRLVAYKKYAGEVVDLTYHKFNYQGKEYTQLELIDMMIDLCRKMQVTKWTDEWKTIEEYQKCYPQLFEILTLVFPAMWW